MIFGVWDPLVFNRRPFRLENKQRNGSDFSKGLGVLYRKDHIWMML